MTLPMRTFRCLLLAGALVVGGCVAATPPAPPYPPVPAPVAETVPKPPPTPDPLIWRPGHWDWTGAAYAWQRGEYVPRAGHGGLWQQGYWAQIEGGYTWVPAHWL